MSPLGGMSHKEIVCIDIGQNDVRIAYARTIPNAREVQSLFDLNISGLADEEIGRAIKASLDDLKLKNPYVINIIPPQQVITKNIEIPSTKPAEIKDILNLQAGRHTPFSREEIIVDYIVIGTFKHSYTKLLLLIAGRDTIKRQFEILNKAGIKLEKVALLSEALASFVPKTLRLNTEGAPAGILYIDENFSNFTVSMRNRPIFVRNIPIGAQQMIDGGSEYQLKYAEEIKRSLESYQSEDIEKNPHTLIVTGAVFELKELEAILNNNMPTPFRITSLYQNIAISDEAARTADTAKRFSFLDVIAPLFAWESLKVDFVPEEIKLRRTVEKRARELIKSGILILAAFVLVFSILVSKIYFKGFYLEKLKKEYESQHKEAKTLESAFTKVSIARDHLVNRGYSLETLSALHELIPHDILLNDVQFDMKDKFSIKGTAESMSTVFSFVDSLEKSEYFKDVKTRYTTKRKEDSRDVTDFEIVCVLEKEF